MPQSLVKIYTHKIFSTKNRQQFIDESIEDELLKYLGGICNGLECFPVTIGGHRDHVHILSLLSKKIPVMKFLEELKTGSSNWIKKQDLRFKDFYWQRGYGIFSVGISEVERVKRYIESQHEHHKITSFQDEFRKILQEHNIDFDERYVWD